LRDRVIGVISIQTYYPDAYTQDQIRLLEIIATQAAIALENARLYTQAQYMAITDSLTGLYNRRYILEQAVRLIEESNQTGAPLSIILLDGDWFKRINDTYGHLAGDRALQVLAETCSQNLRPQDDVGRFGGEEYCILLPGLELEEGGRAAEKIRSALPEQILTFDDKTFTVSASFGVAQYIPGESLEQTISRADDALYRAKTSGRNRIELASP
jgi:diguanylate cyclase (GGDEF)-like protein